jgi:deazaflavin-dependent oxidoreductase (nitroreductase family)
MAQPDQQERRDRNREVVEEFRANGGQVAGPFAEMTLLLLTTVGARTGQPRTWPLNFLADGDRWVVVAGNGGRPTRPGWYHNLLAEPNATIEIGEGGTTRTVHVVATIAEGAEREDLWARQTARVPSLEQMAKTAPGPVPVIILTQRQD